MKLGRFDFRPPWWGIPVCIVVAGLLSALGVWQIDRGESKVQMVAEQKAARQRGPIPLVIDRAADSGDARNTQLHYGQQYIVRGHYDGAHQILMDNQVNQTRVGYRVWTPLVLANGIRIMVDRGWIPMSARGRDHPPDPAAPTGPIRIHGFWRAFPQPGLRMSDSSNCGGQSWPRPLNFPDAPTVRCQYQGPVANGFLLLDPAAAHGFVRDWDENLVGISPARHYAYAAQWFLMALAVVIILFVVNTRRLK